MAQKNYAGDSRSAKIAQLTHADWNTPICSWSFPAALSSWRTWLASWCCTQVHPPEPADWPWIRACQRVECTALENYELNNAHIVSNLFTICVCICVSPSRSKFNIMLMVTSHGGVIVDIMLTLTFTFLLSLNNYLNLTKAYPHMR